MASDRWNGLPTNPAVDGWHWISTLPQLPPSPWRWSVADGVGDWFAPGSHWCSPLGAVACHTYLGPCLTPADLAARVEAERVAAAALLVPYAESYAAMNRVEAGCRVAAHDVAWDLQSNMIKAIRALGPTPAYDAAIKAARVEGMEAAVKIAQADERTYQGYVGCNPTLIVPRIIAAIRAAKDQPA